MVLKGCLRIDMEAGPVVLNEGDLFVVPAGATQQRTGRMPDHAHRAKIDASHRHGRERKDAHIGGTAPQSRAMHARVNSTEQVRPGSFGFQYPLLAEPVRSVRADAGQQ